MNLPSEHRRPRSGFTLIETLIALAVLAVVVGGTLEFTRLLMRQSFERMERAWLVELARSISEEHMATRGVLPARSEGQIGDWQWAVSEARGTAGPGLVEITVTAWPVGDQERKVEFRNLALDEVEL